MTHKELKTCLNSLFWKEQARLAYHNYLGRFNNPGVEKEVEALMHIYRDTSLPLPKSVNEILGEAEERGRSMYKASGISFIETASKICLDEDRYDEEGLTWLEYITKEK